MTRRNLGRLAATVAILCTGTVVPMVTAPPAQAYCATNYTWPGSVIIGKIGSNVPNGWTNSITASLSQWNNIPNANWTIQYTSGSDAHFTVRYAMPPQGFGGAPGLTDAYALPGTTSIVSGDVYLNPNWSWNQNGNLNLANHVADVRTVTVHELGHELMLVHPGDCGGMTAAEIAASMNPNFTQKWTINSDDRAGAAYMR